MSATLSEFCANPIRCESLCDSLPMRCPLKTKFMIFHKPKKKCRKPQTSINNTQIECVDTFNFLGITIDKSLTWNGHIDRVTSKLSKSIGILNRLKHQLPICAKLKMYHSLILSHINYGILIWGHKHSRLEKLQKRAIRTLTCSKYNAHTSPLFKQLNLLKIKDIYTCAKLKFYHKHVNGKLPAYLQSIHFELRNQVHDYNTRQANEHNVQGTKHKYANQSLRHAIPTTLNDTPPEIQQKIYSHSISGLSFYFKNYAIKCYKTECDIPNCYICTFVQ